MRDEIEAGMMHAEKQYGFSTVPRGALRPEEVYAEYQVIRSRPSAPAPSAQKVEDPAPDNSTVLTPEVKRIGFVISVAGFWVSVYAERAALMAVVAPVIGAVIGVAVLGFVVSCFRSSGSSVRGESAKQEVHYHYHQNNYQGTGGQNNQQ